LLFWKMVLFLEESASLLVVKTDSAPKPLQKCHAVLQLVSVPSRIQPGFQAMPDPLWVQFMMSPKLSVRDLEWWHEED